MKWLILSCLLLILGTYQFSQVNVIQFSSQSQAPSAFEEIINQNGREVPYPIEALAGILRSPTKNDLGQVLVPYGRSLQKAFTDFKSPRLLTANGNSDRPIFVGYAERAGQLEVISWNRFDGQFDFLLVKDYKDSLRPFIVKADRALCLTCHQAGGPIFSEFPWNEITAVAKPLAENLTEFHQIDLDAYLKQTFENAGLFDTRVRLANQLLQQTRVARTVCKSQSCRQSLLLLALTDIMEPPLLKELQTLWPADGFAQPSSSIKDRSMDRPSEIPSNRSAEVTRSLSLKIPASDIGNFMKSAAFTGLGFLPVDKIRLAEVATQEQIQTAIQNLNLENWPLSAEDVMLGLFENLKASNYAQYYRASLSPSVANTKSDSPKARSPDSELFFKYCFRCHGTSEGIGPRLPLENLNSLKKDPLVKPYVESTYMPLRLKNVAQPTDEERAEMLRPLSK